MEEAILQKIPRAVLRTLVPLLLILLMGMAAIGGFLDYITRAMEASSREELKNRVGIALQLEGDQMSLISMQYSYWDEAYRKLVTNPDRGFARDHIGTYMTNYMDIDTSLVVNRSGRIVFAFEAGKPTKLDIKALQQAGLSEILAMDRTLKDPGVGEHGFIRFQGKDYLFGVNAFDDQFRSKSQKVSYLAVARELDNEYLAEIAGKYQIPRLRFDADASAPGELSLPIWDVRGNDLAILTWMDPALVKPIGEKLGPVAAAITIAMCLLTLLVVRGELARQHQYSATLSRIAYRDELTGIDNRRAFMENGRREMVRSDRSGRPLLLMMLDVDHFKSINDKLGHAAGDDVLVELAACLQRELREYDLVARIGGEEFAVLIAEMSLEQGKFIAERLRKATESMHKSAENTLPPITLSIGFAEYKAGEDLDQLMSRADRALYSAKDAGRNRCVSANGGAAAA
jgi:diguanylate cyclase (GGDEF)-like protein